MAIEYSPESTTEISEKLKVISTRMNSKSVVPIILLLAFSSIVGLSPLLSQSIPRDFASSPIVQQNDVGCLPCSTASPTATFTSSVAAGDVIVVAVALFDFAYPYGSFSVTDSLGTSYTEVTSICNSPAYANCAGIAVGTATISGADTITVRMGQIPDQDDIFIYELSGVTTTGLITGTGQGSSSPISTSSTTFTSASFLVGVTDLLDAGTFTAGAGFTTSNENSGDFLGYAQYSYSGVTSPATFPATTSGRDWAEAGVALPLQTIASSGPPPAIVYGNVTWSTTYQGFQYIFPASVAINGNQFSATFYESLFAQYELVSGQQYAGYYSGTFGAISGCQEGSSITITATVNGVTESGSGVCPGYGNSTTINLSFSST